jgi:hypothetical protein
MIASISIYLYFAKKIQQGGRGGTSSGWFGTNFFPCTGCNTGGSDSALLFSPLFSFHSCMRFSLLLYGL